MKKEKYSTSEIANMYAAYITDTGIKRENGGWRWGYHRESWKNRVDDEVMFNTFLCNNNIDLDVVEEPVKRSRKFLMLQ